MERDPELEVQRSPARCPFCHDACRTGEPQLVCQECLARHHAACWMEGGACSACGSEQVLQAPNEPPPAHLEAVRKLEQEEALRNVVREELERLQLQRGPGEPTERRPGAGEGLGLFLLVVVAPAAALARDSVPPPTLLVVVGAACVAVGALARRPLGPALVGAAVTLAFFAGIALDDVGSASSRRHGPPFAALLASAAIVFGASAAATAVGRWIGDRLRPPVARWIRALFY